MRSVKSFAVASVIVSFALALVPSEASAQATLMTGLGGPHGYGTACMPPNDDGSWPLTGAGLDLTPAFPTGLQFYRGTYTRGWINNNGSLSFTGAISTYTPDAFPGSPQPMIAPYWADVDTRFPSSAAIDFSTCPDDGSMFPLAAGERSTCDNTNYPSGGAYPAGGACNVHTNIVWWSITPGQIVITWDQVGYYHCRTATASSNSFQMILSAVTGCGTGATGMDFDIEFRYAHLGWDSGEASSGTCGHGGMQAQAGFDSGPPAASETFQSLTGSRTAMVSTDLVTMSNVMPASAGVWRFGVRGGMIMCPSAGMPCDTGMHGICAMGQLSCTGTSMTTCVPFTTPQPSMCNGLDNDCDGTIDTGPCPSGEVCDGERCVPMCVEGACFAGQTCTTAGLCEDTSCIGVMCPAGQRCMGGTCGDPCTGVVCPTGQVCRLGDCVDPCVGLDCGTGQVCQNGMCIPSCPCMTCATGTTCETTGTMTGLCVPDACATMTCPTGETCMAGTCVDNCTGAVCPTGQMCTMGMCVPMPIVDAGPPDTGSGEDSGSGGDTGSTGSDASTGDATVGDGAHSGDGSTADAHGADSGHGAMSAGCACRAAGGGGAGGAAPWMRGIAGLGLALALVRRRRR